MKNALANAIFIWNHAGVLPILAVATTVPNVPVMFQYQEIQAGEMPLAPLATSTVPDVPFYSQFRDITSPSWKKIGCGVTSLAMVIDYYSPGTVSVDTLLKQGIAAGAYARNAGWTYKGLIGLSQKYGLDGVSYDLGASSSAAAFVQLQKALKAGPVIASVHYKFDPKSTIPHLVVIDGLVGGILYYNDPAAKTGEKQISVDDFLRGWKKRYIVVRPVKGSALALAGR